MIEQLPQTFIMHEQFNDAPHYAQFRTCRAARTHMAQPAIAPRIRVKHATKCRQDSDGDGNQREHPRPCFDATDACLMETEKAFRITKAFFTGEASRVLSRHRVSRQVAVRHQVPDAPSPVLVARSRLHQKYLSRVALCVPDATPCPSSLILHPAQGVEPAPSGTARRPTLKEATSRC